MSAAPKIEHGTSVLTIMFVDIVGYSRVAEMASPEECFFNLREILTRINKTIFEFGGEVHKTLGDGLIGVFGRFGPSSPHFHAKQALNCAIAIQHAHLNRDLRAHLQNKPLYPLRIGINSGEVCVGNLGDDIRPDITLIGHGVNIAKRLETSCDAYSILIGTNTFGLVDHPEELGITVRRRLAQIKHHDQLMDAFECNPFEKIPERLNQVTEAYRNFIGAKRNEDRWPVPPESQFTVHSPVGEGRIIDFSNRGIGINFNVFLSRAVRVKMCLDLASQVHNKKLVKYGIKDLLGEVRWSIPTGEGFLHGIQLDFLNPKHGENLVRVLKEAVVM